MRTLYLLFLSLLAMETAIAQPKIRYEMGFREPNSHLITISMTVESIQGDSLFVALPAWRPGRYSIQNYARLVQEVSAENAKGQPLLISKITKDRWLVNTGGLQQAKIRYVFYANILDAGSTFYNHEEIYFNGSNIFMYVPGRENEPVSLKVNYPDGWKAATGLTSAGNKTWSAKDFHELVDCPTIISPTLQHREVVVNTIPFHIWAQNKTNGNLDSLAADIRKMAIAHLDFWKGVVPFKEFHFLYHFVDYRSGHGVEHRNSTSMVLGPLTELPDPTNWKRAWGTTSHELFHAWNVKYLLPAEFESYDYSKEQYSTYFWFAEGFTSYFDIYLNYKAGLISFDEFLSEFETLIRRYEQNPGSSIKSLSEASFDAWLSGYSNDGNRNTSVNFYSQGEILAFMLDLSIRSKTNYEKTLGDWMRWMVNETAVKGRGFTRNDMLNGLKILTGEDYEPFFLRYVDGTVRYPFDKYLDKAGFLFEKKTADPTSSTLAGFDYKEVNGQIVVETILPGSPALKAGLSDGDIIIGTSSVSAPSVKFDQWLNEQAANQNLTLLINRKGAILTLTFEKLNSDNYSYSISKKPDNTHEW